MAAIDQLVKNIVTTTYDALPVDVLKPLKMQVLDILGAAVGGTSFGTVDPLINLAKKWGGKEEATIFVHGNKIPAPTAALVNGYLASVLDYDDTDNKCAMKISATQVVTAFTMAEYVGGVKGKDLMVAVALGCDLADRLARALLVKWPKDQKVRITFRGSSRYLGAAAVSSKLLNLNEIKLRNALSIAITQIGPETAGYEEGQSVKGIWGGLASQAGVMSALLAEGGTTGASDPIEGMRGFFGAFDSDYIPEVLTNDLGKVFDEVEQPSS